MHEHYTHQAVGYNCSYCSSVHMHINVSQLWAQLTLNFDDNLIDVARVNSPATSPLVNTWISPAVPLPTYCSVHMMFLNLKLNILNTDDDTVVDMALWNKVPTVGGGPVPLPHRHPTQSLRSLDVWSIRSLAKLSSSFFKYFLSHPCKLLMKSKWVIPWLHLQIE